MLRPLLLIVAGAVLVQAYAAMSLSQAYLHKRQDNGIKSYIPVYSDAERDYVDRVIVQTQGSATSLDQTAKIAKQMSMNLPFFGLLLKDHVSGTSNDTSNYLMGDESNANTWGDGAYSQVRSCIKKANVTMVQAMQACGPKETCKSDFVVDSFFGTAAGMDWAKDGLLLYQCVALQTKKSQCADTLNGPCQFTILGEYHDQMIEDDPELAIKIGSGATSLSQMAQQIDAFNQANGSSLSLPLGDGGEGTRRKRSEVRRLGRA